MGRAMPEVSPSLALGRPLKRDHALAQTDRGGDVGRGQISTASIWKRADGNFDAEGGTTWCLIQLAGDIRHGSGVAAQ